MTGTPPRDSWQGGESCALKIHRSDRNAQKAAQLKNHVQVSHRGQSASNSQHQLLQPAGNSNLALNNRTPCFERVSSSLYKFPPVLCKEKTEKVRACIHRFSSFCSQHHLFLLSILLCPWPLFLSLQSERKWIVPCTKQLMTFCRLRLSHLTNTRNPVSAKYLKLSPVKAAEI